MINYKSNNVESDRILYLIKSDDDIFPLALTEAQVTMFQWLKSHDMLYSCVALHAIDTFEEI